MNMMMPNLPARPTTQPPALMDGPTAHPMEANGSTSGRPADDVAAEPFDNAGQQRVMLSEEEQLAFFKSLQRS